LLNIQFAKPFHSLLFYVPLRHAGFMPALVRARDLQEIARKTNALQKPRLFRRGTVVSNAEGVQLH